jgi:proteasome lid subunit RPN8/RPN11
MEEIKDKIMLKIVMRRKLKDKIDWLSTNYDKEIAGFILGKVDKGTIRLDDILIPFQEAGYGSVDIGGKHLVKMKIDHPDECEKIIGEWHSHHSMGSFYSSTDNDDFIAKWMAPRKMGVFIVSSKGKHTIKVEIREPFFISLETEDYELEGDDSVANELKKEIEAKVSVPKYDNVNNVRVYSGNSNYGYGGCDYDGRSRWDDGYIGSNYNQVQQTKIRDFDEEKAIKQHVGTMVVYMQHENSVMVRFLDAETCNYLETEFDIFETKFQERDGMFELIFMGFEDKNAAIQLMKDLRDTLKNVYLNRIPGQGDYND